MKKVTWLRTLVTVVLSVTVVSMVYVFTKGWPLMRPPRMEDIKEVTMTDTESGVKKEFVDEENKELAVKLINSRDRKKVKIHYDTIKAYLKL